MGFLGAIAGIGTAASGVGGIMTGLGNISSANSQAQISSGYLDLAQQEAQKQDTWVTNYANSMGAPSMENYKWAMDTLNELHGGKLTGANASAMGTALGSIKQGAASGVADTQNRIKEGLAERGITPESGIGADVLAKSETKMNADMNSLIANKQTEYQNLLRQEAYGLWGQAEKDPSFYKAGNQLVYNDQTGQYEVKTLTDAEKNMQNYMQSLDPNTRTQMQTTLRTAMTGMWGRVPTEPSTGGPYQNTQQYTASGGTVPSTSLGSGAAISPGAGWYYDQSSGEWINPSITQSPSTSKLTTNKIATNMLTT